MNVFKIISAALLSVMLASCSFFKPKESAPKTTGAQTEDINRASTKKALGLTQGWPQSSAFAAREMIVKHGDPHEVTQDSLIWRNVPPFKRIIVHKEVYSSRFPLLHQNSVEHVVDYKAPASRVREVWNYNGSVVLDRVRGEMAAGGDNEAMNILSLNLTNEILQGKRSASSARIRHGKEALAYLNGVKNAYTQTLEFGNQINTADAGETITNKIKWPPERIPAGSPVQRSIQAEEEAPKNKK